MIKVIHTFLNFFPSYECRRACIQCGFLSSASIEACKRNIKFNGASAISKVEAHLADARVYMLTHPKEFDVVRLLNIFKMPLCYFAGGLVGVLCSSDCLLGDEGVYLYYVLSTHFLTTLVESWAT